MPIKTLQEEERKGGKKGRLLGVITLSDVLRYVIGEAKIGEAVESVEEIASLSAAADKPPSPDVVS